MKHKTYGPYEKYIKRPLDCFLATCAFVVLSPVLGITALLVRKKLGTPVLFSQERPGKDEKIFKPMHMQPIYRMHDFITVEGNGRGRTNAYISGSSVDVGADIFARGLCLPSDNKMTQEQQDVIIDIIHRCFE